MGENRKLSTTSDFHAISPLDGRYRPLVEAIGDCLSEASLMRERFRVEVEWLITLCGEPSVAEARALTVAEIDQLRGWTAAFGETELVRLREVERITNHDVKAVEYVLKERLAGTSMADLAEWVHFASTSEDVNNLAYALMLRCALHDQWLPLARELVEAVAELARQHRATAMLSRTHGQAATPTTMGKELAVFVARWRRQLRTIEQASILGKVNGAVGTFGAHVAAYPDVRWLEISRRFVTGFGLTWNPITTQIESHDYMAEIFDGIARFNTILVDFAADIWAYISLGYLRQRVVGSEVGSSTMPHKVNPINFENGESNAGMSTAVLQHLARKLCVSRLQRDLTDSTALRNIGVGFSHSALAIRNVMRGLSGVEVEASALSRDLDEAWEVLAEAIQTVMRKHHCENPYERLKELTRGEGVDRQRMRDFVSGLGLPPAETDRLLRLTPSSYVGLAAELVDLLED